MATIKQYQLGGVGSSLQFGKGGSLFSYNSGTSEWSFSGASDALIIDKSFSSDTEVVNKGYVDNLVEQYVQGLDFKQSVLVATTASTDTDSYTYTALSDDGSATPLVWTGVTTAPTIDGVTLSDGDRLLIKDASNALGNGIFTYDATGEGFRRSDDADNTPANEVSGGLFVFVESGTANAANGFVMSAPTGSAVLGTDDLVFSQFSGAGSVTAGDGLSQTGNVLDVNVDGTTIEIATDTLQIASTYTGQTSITTLGTVATGTWNADLIDLDYGGTGTDTSAFAANSLAYWDGAGGVTELALGAADTYLKVNGTGDGLEYSALSVALNDISDVSITSATDGDLLAYNNTSGDWENIAASSVGGSAYGVFTDGTNTSTAGTTSDTFELISSEGVNVIVADDTPDSATFSLDLSTLTAFDTGAETVATNDRIAIYDLSGTATNSIALSDVISDLDIVSGITTNGILVRTADDTYESRTILASTSAGEQGLTTSNGNGSGGNPIVGLNVNGLTASGSNLQTTDEFVIYDGTNNVKLTGQQLADGIGTIIGSDSSAITDGNFTTVDTDATAKTVTVDAGNNANDAAVRVAEFVAASTDNTSGSKFVFTQADGATDEIQLQASNTAGTGDVDIRLVPQGSGQVFIGDTGPGVIQADDDQLMLVKGGDSTTDAGDLVLEAGTGTNNNGIVVVNDGDSNEIMQFIGVASAVNYFTTTNSATGNAVQIAAAGDDTNVDIELAPKGTGLVLAPSGYDMSGGADEAFATKGYIDSAIGTSADELTLRADITANSSDTSFTIGTMPNVGGKTYYVSRVIIKVKTAFDQEADVTDGTTTLADSTAEYDLTTLGTYIIDGDFDVATAGGATISLGTFGVAPTAGNVIVTVEYKGLT